MRQLQHVLQHDRGIGAGLVHAGEALERLGRLALQHVVIEIDQLRAVGEAEHVAHLRLVDRAMR